MATKASVNITQPERSSVVGTPADTFIWQPKPLTMHVIRPKSAKGRTRPSLHVSQGTEVCSNHTPSSSSSHVIPCQSPSSWKPGTSTPKSQSQGAPDEIPERLQVSIKASLSLNKYPVLPSINRKSLEETAGETVATKTSSLKVSSLKAHYQEETCIMRTSEDDLGAQACPPEEKAILQTTRQGSLGTGNLEEPSDQEPRLLLAVRSPSGQRFVRYFRPTDDLQTVVAVAEEKNNTTYPQCSIETMEVPRRSFLDLTKSLQECRIQHKWQVFDHNSLYLESTWGPSQQPSTWGSPAKEMPMNVTVDQQVPQNVQAESITEKQAMNHSNSSPSGLMMEHLLSKSGYLKN